MLSDGLKGFYQNMGTQKKSTPKSYPVVLWDQFCYSILPVVLAQANTKTKRLEVPLLNEQ